MKLTNLHTNFIGKNFIYYNEIDSTQSEIWRLINSNNIKNGTIVMCDIQNDGKGTHGRKWYTDETGNIAFSVYIETNCNIEKLDGFTLDIANILVKIFQNNYNIEIKIKEPNDLIINNKKIGGILTESKVKANVIKFLVIGIGINTSEMLFPKEIEDIATSIKKEYKIEIDREQVISGFCECLEENINTRLMH